MDNSQLIHDRVNLLRLVAGLEDTVRDRRAIWGLSGFQAWTKATNAWQTIRYARDLLKGIRDHEIDHSVAFTSTFRDIERTLDGLEPIVEQEVQRLAPVRKPWKSLLSELPKPTPRPTPLQFAAARNSETAAESAALMPDADAVTKALLDVPSEPPELLRSTSLPISSSEKPSSLTEKLPAAPVEVKSADEGHSSTRILSASLQTQEQLSKQLAEMASRLKQNTLHFTDALARDRAVIEGAQEKLEGNLTGMTTQRTRLKAQGSKSGNTTWMVLAAIAVVMIAWILTFLLIRIT